MEFPEGRMYVAPTICVLGLVSLEHMQSQIKQLEKKTVGILFKV